MSTTSHMFMNNNIVLQNVTQNVTQDNIIVVPPNAGSMKQRDHNISYNRYVKKFDYSVLNMVKCSLV